MVDIHCHILPNIDDGSKSWEMSVEMCKMAHQDGITHIVATPHCNYEYPYDRESNALLLQELRHRTDGEIEFSLGCDFHMSHENVQDALRSPGKYTIGAGPYMLVEFSDYSIPPSITDALADLCALGLTPVITHPERNAILQQQPQLVVRWIELGCVSQITANSLTGFWGPVAKKMSKWFLQHNAAHIIATDAHEPYRRIPSLSAGKQAAAQIVGNETAELLVLDNPRAVVSGKPLPYHPQ